MDHAETPRRDPMIKVSQLQTYGCSGHTFHTQQPNANGINGQFHRKYLPRSQNAFCERRILGIRPPCPPNGADKAVPASGAFVLRGGINQHLEGQDLCTVENAKS